MMTLKFDMKHICKKGGTGIRGVRGFIWDWVGSLVDRDRVICMEADGQGRGNGASCELRASLRRGSRYRDQTAPQ